MDILCRTVDKLNDAGVTTPRSHIRSHREIGHVLFRASISGAPSSFEAFSERQRTGKWRRDGDSNPGGASTPTRFPGVRLKPLGHPS